MQIGKHCLEHITGNKFFLSCDAVVSRGRFTSNWRNVFHSVSISVDIMALFTVSSPSTVSASPSSP